MSGMSIIENMVIVDDSWFEHTDLGFIIVRVVYP